MLLSARSSGLLLLSCWVIGFVCSFFVQTPVTVASYVNHQLCPRGGILQRCGLHHLLVCSRSLLCSFCAFVLQGFAIYGSLCVSCASWGNGRLFLTHFRLNAKRIVHFLMAVLNVCPQVGSVCFVFSGVGEDRFILFPQSPDLRAQKLGGVFLEYPAEDEYFIILAFFYIWMAAHPHAFR